ncbi:SPBc2 prophage-derived endonuclease YokF precursor [Enhygromyxa salina]|uniref:SPBc2 prophage-derived endonuclease YokF n=1 Tax=Enhygromyxa salina TaxID=215803 RepID=A0A2S9YBK7_9BACT|nr:thermonuclease family protein [Enhygromyxa salina]PRQ02490.1 SPBc2 prophage-derived endonuclease YokF precursor [Enhygromyxa salina]
MKVFTWIFAGVAGCALALGCDDGPGADEQGCGPAEATVTRVIDGDTIELDSGERVRYLMIDTPESTIEHECWGEEAKAANEALVAGQTVRLRYDEECTDDYDRLLAYVELSGHEINRVMVERGHACVLHIPPNGDAVADEYETLEYEARMLDKGLWAACDPTPCG